MIETDAIAEVTRDIALEGFSHRFGDASVVPREEPAWEKLRALGTRLWLDTGDVKEAAGLWCADFEALTTNNTLLNREIQKGLYDDLVRDAGAAIARAAPEIDERQLVLEIAFVLNARHGLKLAETFDAHVSVELHTDLGHDVDASIAYGKRYYDICPERFYVKVPMTPAGLLAARHLGQLGVPINFTLGFSARQNYLAALLAQPRFVNVFMGRLNAFVADNRLGDGNNVGEKATLATQRALLKLREAGRTRSLLIGASMREAAQVAALAGLDVFTMPLKVASQYEEHPPEQPSSQLCAETTVDLADGVTFADFNAAALWDIPEAFEETVDQLLAGHVDMLTPDAVRAHFAGAGFADFLPAWSNRDIETATADGKIPVYDRWKQRLATGAIGLDALMNLSAFQSFATDQNALDQRIRSLL